MKIRPAFVANSSSSSFIVVYRDFDFCNAVETGVIPDELQLKIVAFTDKYLSEAEDAVYLTNDILEYLIQDYEVRMQFGYTPFVEVIEMIDDDDFIIQPEFVGCKMMKVDVDYRATKGNYVLFVERYSAK